MSLFCDAGVYDTDGAEWWWYQPADEAPLATKRSRKCGGWLADTCPDAVFGLHVDVAAND